MARQTHKASLLANMPARMLLVTIRLQNQIEPFTREMILLLVSPWLWMEVKTHWELITIGSRSRVTLAYRLPDSHPLVVSWNPS
jgi:hypothetical protein